MPGFVLPPKSDPVLHPADIFSFINEHRAKSKALCQGPATLLGVALMKEDSWNWVDRRQIGGKTLDYGKECDPLSSLLILSLMPVFYLQILLWASIMVAQNLKGRKLPTEVNNSGHGKGRFVGARTLLVGSHMFGVEEVILKAATEGAKWDKELEDPMIAFV
jgi:hypothetical protein